MASNESVSKAETDRNLSDLQGKVDAIEQSQAVIEFTPDGTIITANKNFLDALGYSLEEVRGCHHRMFVDASYAESAEYRRFWQRLNEGSYDTGEYKRFRKDGSEIWIQATYNPVFDENGLVSKVIKFATDITSQKLQNADFEGQLEAIGKSQAVIEFNMDGTIRTANSNFLATVGYSLDEIKGRHHRMFCEESYASCPEYALFWQRLNKGEFDSGEYKRIGKGGKEVWIQASYNPILDLNGKPTKVVKYAANITEQKELQFAQIEARKRENEQKAAMQEVLENVTLGADQIDLGSQQIASSSQSLASGASEQAASLEEISASLEELSSMTSQNADNAVQATTLSEEARASATKGQDEMKMMSSAMDEIKSSSSQISKIIKVIDEIAFQTNLLALNAAVEAARVGEAFEEIVAGTNKVNTLLSEISSAAKEQSTGISEINSGVTELDKVTQQNAGNAEELASAAQETAAQVATLRQVVSGESSTVPEPTQAGAVAGGASEIKTPVTRAQAPVIPMDSDGFDEF